MPYRRRYKRRFKKRYYGRKRGYKRSFYRRKYRAKKISTRRYKRFWPTIMRSKLVSAHMGEIQFFNQAGVLTNFAMQNLNDKFGPQNTNYEGTGPGTFGVFHLWNLNPKINNLTNSSNSIIGVNRIIATSPTAAVNRNIEHKFPDIKTLCLRYIGYRIMGIKISMRFRPGDTTTNTAADAFPYVVCAIPYQTDDRKWGTYWNGKSTVDQNGEEEDLFFTHVKNVSPHRTVRRVKGFGAKSGGETTITWMMYPWKIYGMTKQQWNNDPRAFMICDDVNASAYNPQLAVALADYNMSFNRTYSYDYTYTMYVKFEGQKFLLENQG